MQQYLGDGISKGNTRELFFIQACTDAGEKIFYSPQGDFRSQKALFEIGGKR